MHRTHQILSLASVLLLLAPTQSARAQTYENPRHCQTAVIVPDYPAWHWHASTAAEGWLRGWADYTRSLGTYNYLTGQAMVFQEQAREHALTNSTLAVNSYFERRRINHEARFPQKTAASAQLAARPARPASAKPACPPVLDPLTGNVLWPAALQTNDFAAARHQVESLLGPRWERPVSANDSQLRDTVSEIQTQLKSGIQHVSPMDYVAATKFCQALLDEVGNNGRSRLPFNLAADESSARSGPDAR